MRSARFVVLGVALAAGLAAAFLAYGSRQTPTNPTAAPTASTMDVLVAAEDIGLGDAVEPAKLRWQAWPADNLPEQAVTRRAAPDAMTEFSGAYARTGLTRGQIIRRDTLVKAGSSGFMAAVLPTGKRAVAITIDEHGATTAGGFILPNDRVDVIWTVRLENRGGADGGQKVFSQTILQNIRVLAIGQAVQEKAGERTASGGTATLEVDPEQAQVLVHAERSGQLSLTLRSITDAKSPPAVARNDNITVIRFGVPVEIPRR
ncbi:Flp pilus assembly protein CpaB [Chelatococcus sp. GCM10030263]|uniref:Flp pilus assembly protein CpaB n=1 Tax=Chelatococcus sp. GCM10030263 TaxID=3273387 RepID=UPI00360D1BDB